MAIQVTLYVVMSEDTNGDVHVEGVRSVAYKADGLVKQLQAERPYDRFWVEDSYDNEV